MLDWLRRNAPRKKLQRRYEAAMRSARDLQRRGDIVAYAARIAEADEIRRQMDETIPGTLDTRGKAG